MTVFFDEKDEIEGIVKHTNSKGKDSRQVNAWHFHTTTRFDKLPQHEEFTIVIYTYDRVTKVKMGCNRYINCRLLKKDYEAKTLEIGYVFDRFYNNSEQGHIRADKIDAFGNAD